MTKIFSRENFRFYIRNRKKKLIELINFANLTFYTFNFIFLVINSNSSKSYANEEIYNENLNSNDSLCRSSLSPSSSDSVVFDESKSSTAIAKSACSSSFLPYKKRAFYLTEQNQNHNYNQHHNNHNQQLTSLNIMPMISSSCAHKLKMLKRPDMLLSTAATSPPVVVKKEQGDLNLPKKSKKFSLFSLYFLFYLFVFLLAVYKLIDWKFNNFWSWIFSYMLS